MADNTRAMTGALDFLHGLDEGEDRFAELSRQLVNNLFVLLRSATMHDLQNEAMRRPVAAMISTARALLAFGDQVVLALKENNFYVNRRLVKLDFGSFQNARYLLRIFGFLDINRLVFSGSPTTTPSCCSCRPSSRCWRRGASRPSPTTRWAPSR